MIDDRGSIDLHTIPNRAFVSLISMVRKHELIWNLLSLRYFADGLSFHAQKMISRDPLKIDCLYWRIASFSNLLDS